MMEELVNLNSSLYLECLKVWDSGEGMVTNNKIKADGEANSKVDGEDREDNSKADGEDSNKADGEGSNKEDGEDNNKADGVISHQTILEDKEDGDSKGATVIKDLDQVMDIDQSDRI